MSAANLTGANFHGANLTGANLFNSTLDEADLSNANLQGADFSQIFQLINLNLTNANLSGADIFLSALSAATVTCSDAGQLGTGISGIPISLPAGWNLNAGTLSVPIVPCTTTSGPIPMWMQAIGRASATTTCPDGYTGSWDAWPNGGKGGYVCNRFVPAYGN